MTLFQLLDFLSTRLAKRLPSQTPLRRNLESVWEGFELLYLVVKQPPQLEVHDLPCTFVVAALEE
jgi:hypothetical protein